jgi:hypothetical protein
MTINKIYLKEDINREYWDLSIEYNELMAKWNEYNSKILYFKIPRLLMFGTKKKLMEIGKEIEKLQSEYLDWNKNARGFALAPKYRFDADQDRELVFLHFTDNLRSLINNMEDCMVLIASNYNRLSSHFESKKNFIIAISAFIVGIIGLLFSTYGLFVQLNIL